MNYFISPLINTVTFIYEWVLASIIRSTMVASPPRKGKNGDDSDCGSTSSSQSQQQRKMFGEHNENVNNTPSSSCTDSKMNCKKRIGTTNQQNDKSDSSPSESKRSPMAVSASKSVSLGPRLRSRQNLLPVCEEESLPNVEEKSTNISQQLFASSSSTSCDKDTPSSPPSTKESSTTKRDDNIMSSPPQPPRNLHASPTNNNNTNEEFTVTPSILYTNNSDSKGNNYNNHRHSFSAMKSSQHYHQSPHWSGQVRVNPFSPIPEQYLRPHFPPMTSANSVARGSLKRKQRHSWAHPGFYNLMNFDSPNMSSHDELLLVPPKKKARFNPSSVMPRLDDFDANGDLITEISPKEVAQMNDDVFDTKLSGNKRNLPQCMDSNVREEAGSNIKRMRINRGRYINDFQEVQFLGSGSFGSVNACLSRLDGCMYAVKSISPTGQINKGNDNAHATVQQQAEMEGAGFLYGGRKLMSNQCAIPPTPRSDMRPTKKRPSLSRTSAHELDVNYDLGMLEGSCHWNEGALRRMLREVFALAALCQQDDFRTFHIVRYQQAWLENDGTLYIQTELCSATLRDEMSGKVTIATDASQQSESDITTTTANTRQTINVSRQLKLLREVLLALELVHQQGMVHLDIKPENIFVKNDLYKLGDFGMANAFTKNGEKSSATPDIEEGDSRYMSKDLLDFSPKDLTKCDIFSLGATLYEICSGQPLPSCGEEWQDLRNGKLAGVDGVYLGDIIKEMMHPDADKRPSATDLLSRDILRHDGGNPLLSRTFSTYKVAK